MYRRLFPSFESEKARHAFLREAQERLEPEAALQEPKKQTEKLQIFLQPA